MPVAATGAPRVLSQRALNRALLARQLLLDRAPISLEEAVEQVGGLQTQYSPSGYVGLWTRVAGFRRDDLTRALEERRLVQATLMRTTIHLVARREYWLYALGVRRARREWAARTRMLTDEPAARAAAERLARTLADGPKYVRDLDGAAAGFLGNHSLWIDLVRVPPSGTWERRRADRLHLAETWVGPEEGTEDAGVAHVVRAYLRGFGPAPWRDVAAWAGLTVVEAKRGGESLDLVTYRDEAGRELLDLRDAPLPDPETPAPVRFLPHFDANLLVHARRTGILPEEHRARMFTVKRPFSVGGVVVDGRVVAGWSYRDRRIQLEEYEPIAADARRELERERQALEAFHA